MPGLHDLLSEIMEHICELIAGSRPSNLSPFSLVSKRCLAASSRSLWHTIHLRITRRSKIPKSVDKLKRILRNRLGCDARVRCISIKGRKPLNHHEDEESGINHLQRAYLDNIAWLPLAVVLDSMPSLSDMEWAKDQLPPCIFHSLNRYHHNCRLRIVGVKCGVDKPLDIDEQPATKLFFMYELLLPFQNDFVCGESLNRSETGNKAHVSDDLARVGSLSTSLTELKYRVTNSSQHRHVQQTGPSEFELVSRNEIGPRARYKAAALSSLDLIVKCHKPQVFLDIRRSGIIMWSIVTHFPALRTLKSKFVLDSSALEWLTTKGILTSLKTLDIVLHSKRMSPHSHFLANFLRSLPPLENLTLAGETHSAQCKKWIAFHAPSLKRLQLTPMDYRDSTFDLISLSALMQPPLPLLEHLRISIQRSKGDVNEVGIYKILGAMPRLQSIRLGLDSSISTQHTEFWGQMAKHRSERDPHVLEPYIVDALVNSAVDEKLTIAIFRTISAARASCSLSLERLEVLPTEGTDCYIGREWLYVMRHMKRSWVVKRRYPGLGSDELSVIQVEVLSEQHRPSRKHEERTETILRSVWPVRPGTKGDWQKDWHSFPLERVSSLCLTLASWNKQVIIRHFRGLKAIVHAKLAATSYY